VLQSLLLLQPLSLLLPLLQAPLSLLLLLLQPWRRLTRPAPRAAALLAAAVAG
jgi:hypothetical protein